jgi:predicted Zn-dependent peptidase
MTARKGRNDGQRRSATHEQEGREQVKHTVLTALLLLLLQVPAAAAPSSYAPQGLYTAEVVGFANGFRVLLKERPDTRNVALRLAVGLGTRHFDCSRRETPHLLEHLLMAGTARHTEAELNSMIEEHGGTWNAVTGTERTIYQVDIFDRYASTGVDVLYEIIADASFSVASINKAEEIVYREAGGRPTRLRRLLYGFGAGKTAWQKADEWLLPGNGVLCHRLVDLDAIGRKDLDEAYALTADPANLTLVVVGNFDRRDLLARLRETFGSMAAGPARPRPAITTPPFPSGGPREVAGSLTPFLGTAGSVSIAFRTDGSDAPDAAAIEVLAKIIDRKLYERIRVEKGLSYAPEAVVFMQPDYGVFYLTADTSLDNIGRVRELFEQIIQRAREAPPTPDEVERAKSKILLQWVQGYETNAGFANYYAAHLSEIDQNGAFRNYEDQIDGVTADDVQRVIARYLGKDNSVVIRSVPTISYTLFFMVLGAAAAVIALVILLKMRRLTKRKKRVLSPYLR